MACQVIKSWLMLVYLDVLMHVQGLSSIHHRVRAEEVHNSEVPMPGADELCHAVDLACVFYFKQVLCLQRSAATTILLRRAGWDASLVIGIQLVPLKSHAWVECRGRILNDKPYILDIYQELERC